MSSLTNVFGFSGFTSAIGIVAPLPTSDVIESPIELKATTRIFTEAKSAKLQGEILSVVTGTEQVAEEMIVLSVVASQFVES